MTASTWASEVVRPPLFELGMGGISGAFPDYPASDQSHIQALPFPYMIYRGAILRADDKDGARARVLQSPMFEFDLSVSASFPAHSGDNSARMGMPDLDWMFELGPRFIIYLMKNSDGQTLAVRVPLRVVFSTDVKSVSHRGYVFAPGLLWISPRISKLDLQAYAAASLNFANEALMSYFYHVGPEYAVPGRPEYLAKEGYMGIDYRAGLTMQLNDRLRLISVVGLSSFGGSANRKSPLFKQELTAMGTVALIWVFVKSDARSTE
jgi:outer membrane scaffolding protein for murein synthesis (MipA/OmpV family)